MISYAAVAFKLSFMQRLSSILESRDERTDTISLIVFSLGTGMSKFLNAPNEIYGCDEPLRNLESCCFPCGEVK